MKIQNTLGYEERKWKQMKISHEKRIPARHHQNSKKERIAVHHYPAVGKTGRWLFLFLS
jgi:hypothetical protein